MVKAERELQRYLTRVDEGRELFSTPGPGVWLVCVPPNSPHGKKVHEAHDKFLDVKKTDGETFTHKHYGDTLHPLLRADRDSRRCVNHRGGRHRLQEPPVVGKGVEKGQLASARAWEPVPSRLRSLTRAFVSI